MAGGVSSAVMNSIWRSSAVPTSTPAAPPLAKAIAISPEVTRRCTTAPSTRRSSQGLDNEALEIEGLHGRSGRSGVSGPRGVRAQNQPRRGEDGGAHAARADCCASTYGIVNEHRLLRHRDTPLP